MQEASEGLAGELRPLVGVEDVRARDVSLLTFIMLCVGNLIMLFYFSISFDIVGLTFSSFGTVMCLILIVVTILFRRNVNHERE